MMRDNLFTKTASVNVCVNLRSCYFLVPEHTLYGPEVRTSLQQVGGERVTESVRADILCNAGQPGIAFYDIEYHNSAEGHSCPVAYEEKILKSSFDVDVAAVLKIQLYFFYCLA